MLHASPPSFSWRRAAFSYLLFVRVVHSGGRFPMSASRCVFRLGLPAAVLLVSALLISLAPLGGCNGWKTAITAPDSSNPVDDDLTGPPLFEEVTESTAIKHTYD